jgi:hypothetical protein
MAQKDLADKTAEELFLYTYNPSNKEVDLFVFPQRVYKNGVTIRYSTAQGDYTPSGGKEFQVERKKINPEIVYNFSLLRRAQHFNMNITGAFTNEEIAELKRMLKGPIDPLV